MTTAMLTNGMFSAKYIEGLENRLYRMEQVLRLSGASCFVAVNFGSPRFVLT